MEDISASCLSLNTEAYSGKKKHHHHHIQETVLRQILATSLAASFHIVFGISLAYSAIINPELSKDESDIQTTDNQRSWVASVISLAVPVGAPVGGILMDNVGRLNTVKIATVPAAIGWVLIAVANGLVPILVGRVLTGIAAALGTGPAIVYITEIARSDIRGSLISFAPAYTSLGMVLAYVMGWFVGWRLTAWLCVAFSIIPMFLIFLIPESAAWLISKGRDKEAMRSLEWFCRVARPEDVEEGKNLAEVRFQALKEANNKKIAQGQNKARGVGGVAKEFLKPTGYKPLLILVGLFVCQQLSGIYITLFYSVEFFGEVGTGINAYLASILIGLVRAIMSVVNTYMMKSFKRRTLVIYSAIGMALAMVVSALFTNWIRDGTTTLTWLPVVAVMLYVVASMFGLLSIPWTMTAELFPIQIRGVAHSLVNSIAYLIQFASIQSYHRLKDELGGIAGVQYFFAAISIVGLVYSVIFLPETQGVELADVQDYFQENTIYLLQKRRSRRQDDRRASRQSYRKPSGDIVRRNTLKTVDEVANDQNENLLEDS